MELGLLARCASIDATIDSGIEIASLSQRMSLIVISLMFSGLLTLPSSCVDMVTRLHFLNGPLTWPGAIGPGRWAAYGAVLKLAMVLMGFMSLTSAQDMGKAERELLSQTQHGFEFLAPSLTYQEIVNAVSNPQMPLTSIEDFLDWMSREHPSILKNPSLVYHTKALQEASFNNPRVILVSKNGKLAFTFNGSSEQLGYNNLEIREYDAEKRRFRYHEIQFGKSTAKVLNDAPQCLACHAQPSSDPSMLRPIVDSYAMWPRIYGGMGDLRKDSSEVLRYNRFVASSKNHPRYKYLKLTEAEGDGETAFIPTGQGIQALNFSAGLWNFHRIAGVIKSHPEFEIFKPSILSSFFAHEFSYPPDKNIPASLGSQKVFGEAYVQNSAAYHQDLKSRQRVIQELAPYFGFESSEFEGENNYRDSLSLQTVLSQMGIDLRDFSMSTFRASLDFSIPRGHIQILGYFLDDRFHEFLGTQEKIDQGLMVWTGQAKKLLSQKEPKPIPLRAGMSGERILALECASCHQEQNSYGAPPIPFGDPAQLSKILNQSQIDLIRHRLSHVDAGKRMPLGFSPLPEQEAQSLVSYLENLYRSKVECK